MDLPSELISQFVKATKDETKTNKEVIVYGKAIKNDGKTYVQLDGSELWTPVKTTSTVKSEDMNAGERVAVLIKNHSATIIGNTSSPSAAASDVDALDGRVIKVEELQVDMVTAEELEVEKARINTLVAANAVIEEELAASKIITGELEADNVKINEQLEANSAVIKNLDSSYANIDFSNIGKAAMAYFYATSGLIKDVVVGDMTIAGKLVGVTISGDLLEGNTVVAEKLVIKGEDGLYYKLNTDGMKVEAQQTDYNSVNGQVIKAKSITASKISVSDLVAFDATIGGFNITDSALYSGTKESIDNTTRGIYLDKTGQIAAGDSNNYLKYFKDANGEYRLDLSVKSLSIDGGIGGQNLLKRTKDFGSFYSNRNTTTIFSGDDGFSVVDFPVVTTLDYRAISSTYGMIPIKDVLGRDLVFSFDLRSDTTWTATGTNIIVGFATCNDESTTRIRYQTIYYTGEINTEWNRVSIKTTIDEAHLSNGSGDITGTTRFYVQIYNYSLKHLQVRKPKLEYGHVSTDWSPSIEDIQNGIDDAAKTATNFISYDSSNGLQLGNKSSGSWAGVRTQITNAVFRILNSTGTVLASYGEKLIELGRNATDAVIKFCGGKGQIEYDATDDYLQLTADNVRLKGAEMASLYSNYTDSNGIFRNGAVHASPGNVQITASGGGDTSNVHVNPTNIQMATKNFYISGTLNDSANGGVYVAVNDGTSGIWTFRQYSNGLVELWGSYAISNVDCNVALGSMYRNSGAISLPAFPCTVYNPNVTANYESDGYGAFLWATTTATTAKPPNYYLVRPTSGNIASGKINIHVYGKWKN